MGMLMTLKVLDLFDFLVGMCVLVCALGEW